MSRSPTTSSPEAARFTAGAGRWACTAALLAVLGCKGRPAPPTAAPCAPPDPAAAALERQLLALVNETRARGTPCGGTARPPAPPVTPAAPLECAARRHSRDMATRGFFDHRNPDDELPTARARRGGHTSGDVSENLSWGQSSPPEVLASWLASPDHCHTLTDPRHRTTGVGFGRGAAGKTFWTQLFAGP